MTNKKEDVEIEIQVQLDGIDELIKHLKSNAKFIESQWQRDVYYSPIDKKKSYLNANPVNEWLRVRYEKGKSSITYKNFHRGEDGFAKYCDEFNSDVSSAESAEKIFVALGFEKIVVVEKNRDVYMDNEFEVSIDDIKGLGKFVEVEYKGNLGKADYEKIKKQMSDYLKSKGCANIRKNSGGYPFMILFPEKVFTEFI